MSVLHEAMQDILKSIMGCKRLINCGVGGIYKTYFLSTNKFELLGNFIVERHISWRAWNVSKEPCITCGATMMKIKELLAGSSQKLLEPRMLVENS